MSPRLYIAAMLALLLLCAVPVRGQEAAQPVLERAREERREAEQKLADFRRERLEQRKQLAEELNAEYDAVDAARDELQALRRELEQLRGATEESPESVEAETHQALGRAASDLGVDIAPDSPVSTVRDRLWRRV
jgi:flagellar biosynthesis chaperone FliJ